MEFINVSLDVLSGCLRGMGYSALPSAISIVGVCGFRLLWVSTVFQKYHTFETLLMVYPVSWAITCIAIICAFIIVTKKFINEQEQLKEAA